MSTSIDVAIEITEREAAALGMTPLELLAAKLKAEIAKMTELLSHQERWERATDEPAS